MGFIKKAAIPATVVVAMASTAMIMPWEGFAPNPYYDIVGKATYCFGDTEGVDFSKTYTKAECTVILEDRVYKDYYRPMTQCISGYTMLPAEVQAAGLSLGYNIGVGAVCKSSYARLAERGHLVEACKAIGKYNKARVKGKLQPVRGLTNRRNAEVAFCLKGAQ